MRRRSLPPPVTPPLPHGLQRGGIFEAAYIPLTYIDARRPTVPTNSPPGHNVAQDIFRSPIAFTSSETVRNITGMSGLIERADQPPIPIGHRTAVRTPGGTTEGGIFGERRVISGMAVGARVPQRIGRTEIIDQRMPGLHAYGVCPDGLGCCGFGCTCPSGVGCCPC